jgi:hypothetical protein
LKSFAFKVSQESDGRGISGRSACARANRPSPPMLDPL